MHHKICAYSLRSVVFCCGLVLVSYYVLRDCHKHESTSKVSLGHMVQTKHAKNWKWYLNICFVYRLIKRPLPIKAYINARTHFREKRSIFSMMKGANSRTQKKGLSFIHKSVKFWNGVTIFACTCLFSSIIRHRISQHVCRIMPKCICILSVH